MYDHYMQMVLRNKNVLNWLQPCLVVGNNGMDSVISDERHNIQSTIEHSPIQHMK